MNKQNVLVSACLMGVRCRYDGKAKPYDQMEQLMTRYHLIPICPEIMGGLPTPRVPAELVNGKVINKEGQDVTEQFQKGAEDVLELAKQYHCKLAILKERSPSCGRGKVYDGSFQGRLVEGDGILAKLLMDHGIQVIGESEVDEFLQKSQE